MFLSVARSAHRIFLFRVIQFIIGFLPYLFNLPFLIIGSHFVFILLLSLLNQPVLLKRFESKSILNRTFCTTLSYRSSSHTNDAKLTSHSKCAACELDVSCSYVRTLYKGQGHFQGHIFPRLKKAERRIGRNVVNIIIFTNPSARAGYDTRSIFKRSLTSFPSPRLVTSLRWKNPVCLVGGRIIGFIPFPRVLVLCEMQSVSSRIFKLVSPCPFPTTITITPWAPRCEYKIMGIYQFGPVLVM